MLQVTAVELVCFVVVLVLSTSLHELSHAWLADRFGDDTPRSHGRITFNPLPHLHPVMSVLIPAAMYWMSNGTSFMVAAWTPVNPFRMRRPRLHGVLTALGGPATNLVIATIATLVFALLLRSSKEALAHASTYEALSDWLHREGRGLVPGLWICGLFLKVNVLMGVFNLLPLPPLDGGHLIQGALPDRLQPAFWRMKQYSFYLLLLLWVFGILDATIFPVIDYCEAFAGNAAVALAGSAGG